MKPYSELTRLGRMHRMHELAKAALIDYGMGDADIKLVLQAGNTLYRVYDRHSINQEIDNDLFEPGQYLLRIYQTGWQTDDAIELELNWMAGMRSEMDLPVPEPIHRLDGGYLTHVSVPGIPTPRVCALTRWVKGRLLGNDGRPEHYKAQGRLMAKMHNFSQQWTLPSGATKRHYDWNGLFVNDAEINLQPGESWNYLPKDWVKPFRTVTDQFQQLIEEWGFGREVYGLIHADMGLDANVLFHKGKPRLIDFDGSGFGYWIYDLAVAVMHCLGKEYYASYKDALLAGYTEFRTISQSQLDKFDLFTAAFNVYFSLWYIGGTHFHPEYCEDLFERMMNRGVEFIKDFTDR